MEAQIAVAAISGTAAIFVSALTYYLAKKKDRDADWRKYKFERYQEFVVALNGIVAPDRSIDAQKRYFEASNTLHLIASIEVVRALHEYQTEVTRMGAEKTRDELERHNVLLTRLMIAIRTDLQIPDGGADVANFTAKLWYYGAAPRAAQSSKD